MMDLSRIYLYRMTHIENISHILQYGITHLHSKNSNPDFKPIGDETLITKRNDFLLENGRCLGEYIPFYFGVRTPMLYVIQNGFNMTLPVSGEHIVYCVSSVQKIMDSKLDFVFTDGHAVNGFTAQYTIDDIQNIDKIIDWVAVKTKYWKDENDLDIKRRKEAEFLILGDIFPDAVSGFLVFNEEAKNKMIAYGVDETKVIVKRDYYF